MPVVINTANKPEPRSEGPEPKSKWVAWAIEGAIILLAVAFGLVVRQGIYETTIVTTGSMATTILPGDRMLVDHRQSLHGNWQRGDVILFHSPASWDATDESLVKRIIALPGETISIVGGQVLINGRELKEPYLKEAPLHETHEEVALQPGQYFVMGDNRNNSDDSRDHGPVSDGDIEGRLISRLTPISRFGSLPATGY